MTAKIPRRDIITNFQFYSDNLILNITQIQKGKQRRQQVEINRSKCEFKIGVTVTNQELHLDKLHKPTNRQQAEAVPGKFRIQNQVLRQRRSSVSMMTFAVVIGWKTILIISMSGWNSKMENVRNARK